MERIWEKPMKRRIALRFLLLGLTVMMLGACTGSSETATPTAAEEGVTPELVATSPAAPTAQVPDATAGSADETPALPESPSPKPVRTELEATDPTTVSLASGRPMLVEFFAFW